MRRMLLVFKKVYFLSLFQCHSDAHIRNKKDETPLDLAAMYGRLTTVGTTHYCVGKVYSKKPAQKNIQP